MKARLVPLFFKKDRTEKFDRQLRNLKGLLGAQADFRFVDVFQTERAAVVKFDKSLHKRYPLFC